MIGRIFYEHENNLTAQMLERELLRLAKVEQKIKHAPSDSSIGGSCYEGLCVKCSIEPHQQDQDIYLLISQSNNLRHRSEFHRNDLRLTLDDFSNKYLKDVPKKIIAEKSNG